MPGAFGLAGRPGWMMRSEHFSAAFTKSSKGARPGSRMYAFLRSS